MGVSLLGIALSLAVGYRLEWCFWEALCERLLPTASRRSRGQLQGSDSRDRMDRGREGSAPPLPPNRTCGFPAYGSPVRGFHIGIELTERGLLT